MGWKAWRIQASEDRGHGHWMQMNGNEGMGGSGCQKSRLDLWLIERDTFLGWRIGDEEWKSWTFGLTAQTSAVLPLSLPLGQSATIRLCLLFFLLVARPVPHQPRTCSTSTTLLPAYVRSASRAPSLTRSRADFSAKIQSRHSSAIFSLPPISPKKSRTLSRSGKIVQEIFPTPPIRPNLNNIEDVRVGTSPIRSTMSPRVEIATHRDYCTTKLRVTVSSTPPRLYALKSSVLDYRSYLENKIKVVIRREKR